MEIQEKRDANLVAPNIEDNITALIQIGVCVCGRSAKYLSTCQNGAEHAAGSGESPLKDEKSIKHHNCEQCKCERDQFDAGS